MFALVLALFTSIGFSQQNCKIPKDFKPNDMRNEFGPVRSQDTVGWCFAYDTPDLISHWIYKNYYEKFPYIERHDTREKKNMLSAIWATGVYFNSVRPNYIKYLRDLNQQKEDLIFKLNNYIENHYNLVDKNKPDEVITKSLAEIDRVKSLLTKVQNPSDIEGGDPKVFFDLVTNDKVGYCLESDVPSDDVALSKEDPWHRDIRQLQKSIFSYLTTPSPTKEQLECTIGAAKTLFPELKDSDSIGHILEKYSESGDPIYILARKSCKNKLVFDKSLPKPEMIPFVPPDDKNLSDIQSLIGTGSPVLIVYDGPRALQPETLVSQDSADLHSSIIVGQRFNCKTNEVDYIMRNSGAGKGACKLNLKSFAKENLKAPFSCDGDEHYLIPESHLKKHLKISYVLKNKEK